MSQRWRSPLKKKKGICLNVVIACYEYRGVKKSNSMHQVKNKKKTVLTDELYKNIFSIVTLLMWKSECIRLKILMWSETSFLHSYQYKASELSKRSSRDKG